MTISWIVLYANPTYDPSTVVRVHFRFGFIFMDRTVKPRIAGYCDKVTITPQGKSQLTITTR